MNEARATAIQMVIDADIQVPDVDMLISEARQVEAYLLGMESNPQDDVNALIRAAAARREARDA